MLLAQGWLALLVMLSEIMRVREETLRPYGPDWAQPSGSEVRQILKELNLTGAEVAALIGIRDARTIRKWTAYDANEALKAKEEGRKTNLSPIPYAAWAILVFESGRGAIWSRTSALIANS